jgi:hypothetical protein
MKKKILVEKRKEARALREKGWSIRKIARYLVCSKDSVQRWLGMEPEELEGDRRGWPLGKTRKHGKEAEERILGIRARLEGTEGANFGAGAVKGEYKRLYGEDMPEWFINRTVKRARELGEREIVRADEWNPRWGRLFERLGKVAMSMEFFGARYGRGKGKPVRFLTSKYLMPARAGIATRVSSYNSHEAVRVLTEVLSRYKRPDVIKMDFHPAFGAVAPQPGCLGNFAFHLLNLGIMPLYVQSSFWPTVNVRQDVKELFSPVFLRHLCLGDKGEGGIELDSLWLEYSRRGENPGVVKESKSYYRDAFTEKELFNRRADSFLANHVYFLRRVDGGDCINILGVETDPGEVEAGTFLLCRLDIKEGRMALFRYLDHGGLQLHRLIDFPIKNVLQSVKHV